MTDKNNPIPHDDIDTDFSGEHATMEDASPVKERTSSSLPWILGALAVLIIGGLIWYFLANGDNAEPETVTVDSTTVVTETVEAPAEAPAP